ncbi:MAG: hypothetical protein RRC34_01670 [Lentisphaeria bacterium]|nr:hypothetical protein [Lentisphaeria bacterium]
MPPDFLNTRLVTAKGFGPGDSKAPEASDDLETILEKEDTRTRKKVIRRDVAETGRRKSEVERDLNEIIATLEDERRLAEEKLTRFAEVREMVSTLPDNVDEKGLFEVKRAIREAHMEMVKHHRDSLAEDGAPAINPAEAWMELSFSALTKAGLALTWPLILAIFLAAGVIAAVLYLLFGV